MNVTPYSIAERFTGIREVSGSMDNPQVLAMLRLDASWPEHDEVPWCSAFVNYVAWLLRLPRSKDLRARSWLGIGTPIDLREARQGFDVVILNRGGPPKGAEGPGHVGFFSSTTPDGVWLLGGNQSNGVKVSRYAYPDVLGVRRLA